jgi:hypothetical protein
MGLYSPHDSSMLRLVHSSVQASPISPVTPIP